MAIKKKKIIQCPLCNSNRLYIRKGLLSDLLISLLIPVRSYSCGSCSSNFRRFGNYFLSRQALIHLVIILGLVIFFKPQVLSPDFWTFQKSSPAVASNSTLMSADNSTIETSANQTADSNNSTVITVPADSASQSENATEQEITAQQNSSSPLSNDEINAHAENSTDQASKATPEPEKTETAKTITSGTLSSIYFSEHSGRTSVRLDLGGAPLSYTSFLLKNPDRIVVDILGKWQYKGQNILTPENPVFSKFRIGVYPEKIRLVMDLKGKSPAPVINKTGTGLTINLK